MIGDPPTRTKPRVLVLFGTRPEIIKLAPVVRALEARAGHCETLCVTTGQHSDLVHPFARELDVRIHEDLEVGEHAQQPSGVCARVLDQFDRLLERVQPDVVLVQGDTTSALAGALAAFHRRAGVAHVEAGLRSGCAQSPFPEEMNRRLITRLADLHFAATRRNMQALQAEQVPSDDIVLSGNPIVDSVQWAVQHARPSARATEILARAEGRRLLLLTTHRRESFGTVMRERLAVLADFVARHDDVHLIFPIHPNPEVGRQADAELADRARIDIVSPLEYLDFVHLMQCSWLIVSDSGGVQEECCSLRRPLLVIRDTTERPEAIEAGVARLVGEAAQALSRALDEAHAGSEWFARVEAAENPFGDGDAGERIASALLRWIDRHGAGSAR